MSDDHDTFTDRARHIFTLAEEEARALNHHHKGTEHLLLGLLREGDGVAARVLTTMGVRLPKARSTVEWILGRGDGVASESMDWSPRARKVLGLAAEEAERLDHPAVDPEHLLVGIIREGRSIPAGQGKGIAAGALETLGVDLRAVQEDVLRAMDTGGSGDNESPDA